MQLFTNIKKYIVYALVFLFPLFFLPITQEYFVTNKLYLLAFGSLLLLAISAVEMVMERRMNWERQPLDGAVIFFAVAVGLSTLITSPNKFQALLNPNLGVTMILSLTILYFYLSRQRDAKQMVRLLLNISAIVVAVLSIFFTFNPFQSVTLPYALQFLKNPVFTPLGNQLDLLVFLGFVVCYNIPQFIDQDNEDNKIMPLVATVLSGIGILFTLVSLYRVTNGFTNLLLPPYKLSWYATVEILKNPVTALFGAGIDNFESIFSSVKDINYNTSPLWQVPSFAVARAALLHITSEAGIFGFIGFVLLLLQLYKQQTVNKITVVYLILAFLIFPPSLVLFFVLYISLSTASHIVHHHHEAVSDENTNLLPLYVGSAIIMLALVAGLGYFLGRSYVAEYTYKKSLDVIAGVSKDNVYELQRKAVILNPYIEKYRLDFSRLNLVLANNLASKDAKNISSQDRQTIAEAIQAAISEAKNVVSLNPQKATNWQNLAAIYRNVINVAQGADAWTISAYQRAIVADPQNPSYRLDLGGIFYSLGNFDDSIRMFEQSIALKPDWSNAHYNLAWALYQKKDYVRAASEMQNVISLLDPKKDEVDYKKAQKDLAEFKSKIPAETTAPSESMNSQLKLPSNGGTATLEPKLKLPKNAEPQITLSPSPKPTETTPKVMKEPTTVLSPTP